MMGICVTGEQDDLRHLRLQIIIIFVLIFVYTFHTLKANWMSLADISKSSSTRNIAKMHNKIVIQCTYYQ